MKHRPKVAKKTYLNLLVALFGLKRQTFINECWKKKIDLSDELQVAVYIKNKLKGQIK